jgi:YD repeat-containing protein
VTRTYAYASGACLTGVTTAGVTQGRTTDNGGRETALALMSHQLAPSYDSDDHVTRVVDGASTTDFAFDAAGRRVSVTSGGSTKRFLTVPSAGGGYESPQAVTDASGALIASYVLIARGVRDAGPFLEMISDDGRCALRIVKETGVILYGKIDLQKAEYIWRQLR